MGRAKEVDQWLARYDNPMKPVVLRMRDIILAADPRVGECIKWQAPTFTFEGNIASFFPRAKQHASLMFHQGAMIPGRHPILQGGGGAGRFVKIASVAEADARATELAAVIRAWIELKIGDGPSARRPAAARAKAKKSVKAKAKPPKKGAKAKPPKQGAKAKSAKKGAKAKPPKKGVKAKPPKKGVKAKSAPQDRARRASRGSSGVRRPPHAAG